MEEMDGNNIQGVEKKSFGLNHMGDILRGMIFRILGYPLLRDSGE